MEKPSVPVVIVVGMSKDGHVIGNNNELLWHVPEDMKRFKKLTMGHPVIMGRKTFESILDILGKPLPGRLNIVLSRNPSYRKFKFGVKVVHSLEEAFAVAMKKNPTEIHIGGGAELYKETLPLVDRLYVTYYHDEKPGDSYFPPFLHEFEVAKEHPIQEHKGLKYQWIDYQRPA